MAQTTLTREPPRRARDDGRLRVVIADAHARFRHALRMVVAADDALAVVADVPGLASAGEAARHHRAAAIVADADLFSQERVVLGPLPSTTALVVVGMDDDAPMVREALHDGADAYVVKDRAAEELVAFLLALGRARS